MARQRNIRPSFFSNEQLATCSMEARLLFIGLWCICDREGRLEDRPLKIKAEVFPFDSLDVNVLLQELSSAELVVRYQVGDGPKCLWIRRFHRYQTPHDNEPDSTLPECELEAIEALDPKSERLKKTREARLLKHQTGNIKQETGNTKTAVPISLNTPEFLAAWSSWTKHRTEIRKPLRNETVAKQMAKLERMGESRAIAALEHSIAQGWMGIFEPPPPPKSAAPTQRAGFDLSELGD